MPEELNQQSEQTQTEVKTPLTMAEFDPEKESLLKNQEEPKAETVEEVQDEKTQEAPVSEDKKVESEILADLNALDAAKNLQTDIERSKIAQTNAQSFLAEIDAATQKAWSEANAEISKISLQRTVIESEFQSALSNFDIAKATKLEKQIIQLSKLYTQKQAEANLVNEKLDAQLSIAFSKWKKWTAEFLDSIRNEEGYKKAYYIIEKVKSMDKEKAKQLLNEPEIEAHLGVWLAPVKDYVERIES